MQIRTYGHTLNLGKVDYNRALNVVADALKGEGFGILTEIDVKATLKKRLDVEFPRYKIFGACNPSLAYKALSADPFIGLLLPCNVIVFEDESSTIFVSIINPVEMFKVVGCANVEIIAEQVDEKLLSVLAQLQIAFHSI